jgi:hypothetical protein
MGDNWIAVGEVTIVDGKKRTIDRFEAISAGWPWRGVEVA